GSMRSRNLAARGRATRLALSPVFIVSEDLKMMSPHSPLGQGGPVKAGVVRVAKLVLLLGGFLGCGCSPSRGPKVTGTVLLDGTPLADAVVNFYPKSPGGDKNFAVTDTEGHFEVKPDKARRTLSPGSYNVLIRKYAPKDSKRSSPDNREFILGI